MRSINNIYVLLIAAAMMTCVASASAQNHAERKLVREGNREFNEREYSKSLERYNEALEVDPDCMEAKYNRANAFHYVTRANQSRATEERDTTFTWDKSNKLYEELLKDELLSDAQRAEVYRNVGESLMRQQQHEAALNAFRESLLLNSNDQETKHNYVLAKRIVDQKRNQQQQNQDQNRNQNQNQDQQQDQNQDQQQDQSGDSGDDNKDQNQNQNDENQNDENNGDGGDESQDQNEDKEKEKENGQGDGDEDKDENGDKSDEPGRTPPPRGLSDEQERLLDAVQGEEDKTQEKVEGEKAAVYLQGKKNW